MNSLSFTPYIGGAGVLDPCRGAEGLRPSDKVYGNPNTIRLDTAT